MSIVDKLTPYPPQAEVGTGVAPNEPLPPKPALTSDEVALHSRCCTFALAMLKRHGITLSSNDAKWVGAELADFVAGELAAASKVSDEAEAAEAAEK